MEQIRGSGVKVAVVVVVVRMSKVMCTLTSLLDEWYLKRSRAVPGAIGSVWGGLGSWDD